MRRRDFMKLCVAGAVGPGVLAGTVEPERLVLSGNCRPPQMVCFSTPHAEREWARSLVELEQLGDWYTKQRGWTQLNCLV